MYLAYVYFVTPDMSGSWIDHQGQELTIKHKKFTGELLITVNGMIRRGLIADNLFKFGDVMGIWNYKNVIVYVDGGGLQRIN
jgi:hypothetical protein